MRAEQNTMVSRCGSSALPRLSLLRPAKRFFDQYSFEIRCTVAVPFLQCRSYRQRGWPSAVRRLDPDCSSRLFLLVLNRWYFLGVALFCPVQFLYALRLRRMQISPGPLWPRAAASGGALLMLGLSGLLRPLTMLICVYFPQLFVQRRRKPSPSSAHGAPLFRCGLWPFVGCDICVGLHNLVLYLPLSAGSAAAVQFCMWALYLPSQVLIALSVRRRPTA